MRLSTQYAGNLVGIGRVPGPYRPQLEPGLRGDQLGAGRGARAGRRDRLAAAGPARRRGDLGRRSARARHRRRGGLDRRRPAEPRATARPGCATATASRRRARCRTPTTDGDSPRLGSASALATAGLRRHPSSHRCRIRCGRRSSALLGERGFIVLYSLVVAVATLGWMILAWRDAARPDAGLGRAALVVAGRVGVMLFACILLVGSLVRNPAFPRPGAAAAADHARADRRLRDHPPSDELELHPLGAGPPRRCRAARAT